MSPPKGKEVSSQPSEIVTFFSGKSVFITGAAGYLGAVLLEILLRCCPGIRRIYILLRPKKGVLPQYRKECIFKKVVFSKIKEKNPDVLEKVIVVAGDVTQENLGMSDEDLHTVIQEVSIVYHCAASISFFRPLRYMLLNNFIGTINVIEFCRKLKKLDALVHTSTAYSNSNRMEIEEKIYELPFSTEEVIDHFRNNRDDDLMQLFSTLNPMFPNFYVFTKCLAEKVLQDKASDIPVAIVRPSIITCIWKGVLPGYVEEGAGLFNLCVGIGKGFIRVLRTDTSQQMDSVPADIVANSHIAAAWCQASQRLESPSVYNCVSTPFNPFTWGDFISSLFTMALKHPLPNSYQTPGLVCCKNSVSYWFRSIFDHYMPCMVIDTLLWLSGRTPRLYKLYRFYDKAMLATLPFTTKSWKFDCGNYKNLMQKLNATDAEIFPHDLSDYTPKELTKVLPTGAPIYKWESDKKSFKDRMRTAYMHYLLTIFIKCTVLGTVVIALYMIVF